MNLQTSLLNIPAINLKAVAGGVGGSWYLLMEGIATLVAEVFLQIQIEVVAGGGVSAITSVIGNFADRVRQIHPAAQFFDPARAYLQGRGALHPGAARYFRSKGFI